MKRFAPPPVFALLAVTLLAGCGSAMQQAYITRTTFNQVGNDLNNARAQHLIDDATFAKINATEHNIAPTLDALDAAAVKADQNKVNIFATFDFNTLESSVLKELALLTTARTNTKAK